MAPDSIPPLTREWLSAALIAALSRDHGLTPLPGFNPDRRGTSGFTRVFFGARCNNCTTAAVLSVEAKTSKTREEVEAALPLLVQKLLIQRDAFLSMPCSAHQRLRSPAAH